MPAQPNAPTPSELALTSLIQERQRLTRAGMWWLLLCLGGGIACAAWAPLEEGVPAPAQVVIDTRRVSVQHLQGGIVRQVLVREGETVKINQPLVILDQTTGQAQQAQALQNLAALEENLKAQYATKNGIERAQQQRKEQETLITQELKSLSELVRDGYAPKVQQLQLQRVLIETRTQQSELLANLERSNQAIYELRHQIKAAEQRLKAAQQDLDLLNIRATTSGQVIGLQLLGNGSVIQPAQRLMDIVPLDPNLVLEARIPPRYIDRVTPGQTVHVRFHNFAQAMQIVADGKLQSISSDALTDNTPGHEAYYLARITLTADGQQKLGQHTLQAGMPADVVVLTGERSLLQYLLQPFAKRIGVSLKEQ